MPERKSKVSTESPSSQDPESNDTMEAAEEQTGSRKVKEKKSRQILADENRVRAQGAAARTTGMDR